MSLMPFNPNPPYILHIDLNSCFATIEQQANPHLRGKPVVVAAYDSPGGCIIAPSVEAKRLGVRVGMRVREGKILCPDLCVLAPDPWKYRDVHLKLRKIVSSYTSDFTPKSIDEFTLNLEGFPALRGKSVSGVACDIKRRIRHEIGEWVRVSIGIAPNRFLAKVAAGLHKPDGLDEINKDNFLDCYSKLKLTDLPYIKLRNTLRLNNVGIYTVLDFYNAPLPRLKAAFASINSYYWYLRLRGWEIDSVNFSRRSYGNSYALPKPLSTPEELSPILSKLTEKLSSRFRKAGYKARGIHLGISFRDHTFWHKGVGYKRDFFDSREIYKEAFKILLSSPRKPVREIAVSCFGLIKCKSIQLGMFDDVLKKESLVRQIDEVNERWGNFIIAPAKMFLNLKGAVPDRIAFGGVKELEEFTLGV